MIHEAVVWSNVHKKWFFLPRKASKSKYNDVDDERHGTNLLLVAGDYFLNREASFRNDVTFIAQ